MVAIGTRSHSGGSLHDHLRCTARLLASWGCEDDVCFAGACHSVYGTEAYPHATLDHADRARLRALVGDETERLAWLFGVHVRASLWPNFFDAPWPAEPSPAEPSPAEPSLVDRFTGREMRITRRELLAMLALTAANWIEQLPRVPDSMRSLGREELLGLAHLLPARARGDIERAYGVISGASDGPGEPRSAG